MEESASAEIQEANAWVVNVNENSESEREANSSSGNGSQNGEVDREANPSIGNEHQDRVLANDIIQMLESSEPPLSPGFCIYRVPQDLRKLNEKAYTPKYISIGPFHRGDKRLETMEKLKVRYLKIFLKKAEQNMEKLISTIRDREGDVRRCYAETSRLSSDNYVKMILLDASFIIVFFLIMSETEEWECEDELVILMSRLMHDMSLLENQLPFFVIEELYNLAFASHSNYPSFTQLAFRYFGRYNTQKMSPDLNFEIKHFVDLLRTFFLPQPPCLPQRYRHKRVVHLYTASQLHEAGVKFKLSSSKCLFDLKFTNGVLEIPCFQLKNFTECFFRNIMALEQFHYRWDRYICDYIRILDFLIDTTKDVDLLVRKRIMVNTLGDSNTVATMVNNLNKHTLTLNTNSDYYRLCKDLNTFYDDRRQRWKATLRRDYFSNPWRTTATIAAIVLLVLTLTQTICSIISLP
ncbi:UPF0481 protein At3g47200-like [Alnus glutinosa]|uniref:UPF0481 protein At3g47200-like n=1 Tax=Alnus glutinosa TaxID=3517 RepID=UPI002D766B3A|nr:UPF0481 protein At3g47200-like [Alnus glutinosa]XP_062177338.1 UPF0481 protein At3g47200-like [Alnus glutinosa]